MGKNTAIFWMLHYQIYKTSKTKQQQQQKLHTYTHIHSYMHATSQQIKLQVCDVQLYCQVKKTVDEVCRKEKNITVECFVMEIIIIIACIKS